MITKKRGRPSKKPSEAQLDMLYSMMTAREIAEQLGVSTKTVERWIYEYRRQDDKEVQTNAN